MAGMQRLHISPCNYCYIDPRYLVWKILLWLHHNNIILICSSKLIARNKLWMISSLLWSVPYCNCRSVYDSLCVPPLLQCKAAITITHLSVNNREEDIKADHKDSWLITTSSIDMHCTLTHALLSSFSFDHLYNIMYSILDTPVISIIPGNYCEP